MSKNGNITQELNYVTANRFYVEIESQLTASFTECDGLGVQVKKEVLFEGGVNEQQRVLLGQSEFSDVTLRRGLSDSSVFWDWISPLMAQRTGNQAIKNHRRNVNILVFNQAGEIMQCWTLIGAIATGWKAPGLQAHATTAAIEELTLAYEGIKVTFKTKSGGASILEGRGQSGYFSSN
ncbi:phage tail protein [Leptolyngbya sp. AN02str]|uniref:phage tail protein n=1 Tax=Leptolyngbya sp. AN02str TaxID=3423363 RepID=UPI003D317B60